MKTSSMEMAIPLTIGQTALLIFMQKMLYGHGVSVFSPQVFANVIAYDYWTVLLSFVCVCMVALCLIAKTFKWDSIKTSHVAMAGAISLPCGWYVLFGSAMFLSTSWGAGALVVCSMALCISFCIVSASWFEKLSLAARTIGVRGVVLCILASCFIYCMITPSNGNNTLYILVVELLSLPLAAAVCCVAKKWPLVGLTSTAELGKREKVPAVLGALVPILFLISLLITYVDMLNAGFPTEHIEQPTFYALLLAASAIAFGVVYAGGLKSRSTLRTVWLPGVGLAALYGIGFLVIAYYSVGSGAFNFQFSCAFRRLVVMGFYTLIVGLALARGTRLLTSVGVGFVVPLFFARIAGRTALLQIDLGFVRCTVDFRATVLLVLGVCLIVCLAVFFATQLNRFCGWMSEGGSKGTVLETEGARRYAIDAIAVEYALSEREKEVLKYLSLGYSAGKMASVLEIAENTVGTHVRSVYKKTDLHSKQEIIDFVQVEMDRRCKDEEVGIHTTS